MEPPVRTREAKGGLLMATSVRLTVLTGPHANRKFCFCGPTRCFVGRALDCFVQLSGAERDQLISRHHCQLHVDPPSLHVEELGSTNGTYINGTKVPTDKDIPAEMFLSEPPGVAISDGDLLTVGGTTLQVAI